MDGLAASDLAHALGELRRRIDGIPVAMVTTIAPDDVLRSRPMLLERVEADATLVFLTHLSSHKVDDVHHDPRVNMAFVSESGGADDPDSAIFTVQIERVDYWDVPTGRFVGLWGVAKALATGQVAESGDQATLDFRR